MVYQVKNDCRNQVILIHEKLVVVQPVVRKKPG